MSDEERTDEAIEVEGHATKAGANEEPAEEGGTEFEAHVHKTAAVRMDSPSNI